MSLSLIGQSTLFKPISHENILFQLRVGVCMQSNCKCKLSKDQGYRVYNMAFSMVHPLINGWSKAWRTGLCSTIQRHPWCACSNHRWFCHQKEKPTQTSSVKEGGWENQRTLMGSARPPASTLSIPHLNSSLRMITFRSLSWLSLHLWASFLGLAWVLASHR